MTYDEWLKNQVKAETSSSPITFEEYKKLSGISYGGTKPVTDKVAGDYETQRQYADELLRQANQSAEREYNQAVAGANTRYKLSTSNYGANAEQISSSGLNNSGYAKYLTDRAYGKMVDETLAASAIKAQSGSAAQNEYNKTMLGIKQNEQDAVSQIESNQKKNFEGLLTNVNLGAYTDFDQVNRLGINANLSDDQMRTLYDAFEKNQDTQKASAYETLLNNIDQGAYSDFASVQELIEKSNLSHEQASSLYDRFLKHQTTAESLKKAESAQENGDVAEYYSSLVSAGELSKIDASKRVAKDLVSFINSAAVTNIDDFIDQYKEAVESGVLHPTEGRSVQEAFATALKSLGKTIFKDANGNWLSDGDAVKVYNSVMNSGLLTFQDRENFRNTYNKKYDLDTYLNDKRGRSNYAFDKKAMANKR